MEGKGDKGGGTREGEGAGGGGGGGSGGRGDKGRGEGGGDKRRERGQNATMHGIAVTLPFQLTFQDGFLFTISPCRQVYADKKGYQAL